jgi:hypothetical protein
MKKRTPQAAFFRLPPPDKCAKKGKLLAQSAENWEFLIGKMGFLGCFSYKIVFFIGKWVFCRCF